MAQPTRYTRQYSFSNWERDNPSKPKPATGLESEYNALKLTLDQTLNNLALIQRDDGEVANETIGVEQLKPEVGFGLNTVADWAANTSYDQNDGVYYQRKLYRALEQHISTGSFSDDLNNGKWALLVDHDQFISQAETEANNAAASFDAFDDRYLGEKASAPTTDNDGDPLTAGVEYFDTTLNFKRVYDGANWQGPNAATGITYTPDFPGSATLNLRDHLDRVDGGVRSITDLQGVDVSGLPDGTLAYMAGRTSVGDGAEGTFRWDSSDLSTEVSNDEVTANEGDGGIYVAPSSDKTGASGAWVRLYDTYVWPEWYHDGSSDWGPTFNHMDDALDNGDIVFLDKWYSVTTPVVWKSNNNLVGLIGRGPFESGFECDVGSSNIGVDIGEPGKLLEAMPLGNFGIAGQSNDIGIRINRPTRMSFGNIIAFPGSSSWAISVEGIIDCQVEYLACSTVRQSNQAAPANGVRVQATSSAAPNANQIGKLTGRSTNGTGVLYESTGRNSEGGGHVGQILVESNGGRGLIAQNARNVVIEHLWHESNGSPSLVDNVGLFKVYGGNSSAKLTVRGSSNQFGHVEGSFDDLVVEDGPAVRIGDVIINNNLSVGNNARWIGKLRAVGVTAPNAQIVRGADQSAVPINENPSLLRWDSDTLSSANFDDDGLAGWSISGAFTGVTITKNTSNVLHGKYSAQVNGPATSSNHGFNVRLNVDMTDLPTTDLYVLIWTYGQSGFSDWQLSFYDSNGRTLPVADVIEGQWTKNVALLQVGDGSDWDTDLRQTDAISFVNATGVEKDYLIGHLAVFTSRPAVDFVNDEAAPIREAVTLGPNGNLLGYASAAPSSGYWRQGDIVFDTAPSSGGHVGWVCVSGGNPGTWKTFGDIT